MGRYFEDFASSEPVASGSRTVTEDDVIAFAALTGDTLALHTDEEYAKTTAFGRRVAHGALVFSLSIGLATRTKSFDETLVAFTRVDKLRFVAPVFPGDTIHVVSRVVERHEISAAQGAVVFETRVFNHHDDLVLVYLNTLLLKRRVGATPE